MTGLFDDVARGLGALRLGEDIGRLRAILQRVTRPARARLPRGAPDPPDPLIELALTGPDRALDVAVGAARIAREDDRTVDVARTLGEVDAWSSRLRVALAAAPRSPEARLAALNRVFFDDLGFAAAPGRPALDEDRLSDLLLPYVVRRRRGHCVGLSTVYLALAHRADLPVYGVSAPGHFFVRWEGAGLRANVELTARGARHDDAYYVERFRLGAARVDRGVYLQSLRRREVLVEVLNNRANLYWDRGDEARAARDLDRVVRASHNYARAWVGRGFAALQRGDLSGARQDLERALALDSEDERALLLLGQVLLREGRTQAAADAFERACQGAAAPAQARTYLGRALQLQGRLEEAHAAHREALREDPGCHMAWVHIALAHLAGGDAVAARDAYRSASRLAPQSLTAREGLALLARGAPTARLSWAGRARRWRLARTYEARLDASPDADAVRAAYVRFLVASGCPSSRGVAEARLLAEHVPTARHVELLARLLWREEEHVAALEALDRALGLLGDASATYRERLDRLRADWGAAGEP